MKLNDNFSNNNDLNYLNKFDFSKNDSFGMPLQNGNSKNIKEYSNNINQENVDPRLELTLNYLDINSTLPTFITNNISFNDLLLLSKNDLVELGFSLVERNRIINFSQEFKRYGKKYTIQEIDNFFNEFKNLNMRLISINNNKQSYPYQQENEIKNININSDKKNLKNYNIKNYNNKNNKNYKYDNDNNYSVPYTNELYLKEKRFQTNNNNLNMDFYPKNRISPINNKNTNNNDYNNNVKVMNNYISPNKPKNKNNKIDSTYQDSLNFNINYNHNNNLNDSNKLVRHNSKASKNSSYSKNSKSRLATTSKSFLPPPSSSGSIVQKYQNLSEEIDNYFKKYNDNKEQKKNRIKKYQIINSSNNSKKNYSPIFVNNISNNNLYENKKKKNSYINNIDNLNNANNINDINSLNSFHFNDNEMDEKLNNELSLKLQELEKKKKELREKLSAVCDKENKKKIIIQYLEDEENK